MRGFLLRKTGAAIVVVFVSSVIVFAGVRAIPGDTADALAGQDSTPAMLTAIRHEYLLDRPLYVQYTKALLAAAVIPDPTRRGSRAGRLEGDPPRPLDPPSGGCCGSRERSAAVPDSTTFPT